MAVSKGSLQFKKQNNARDSCSVQFENESEIMFRNVLNAEQL